MSASIWAAATSTPCSSTSIRCRRPLRAAAAAASSCSSRTLAETHRLLAENTCCRSCIVRILDRCARVRATRFRAIGFLNRKTFCGFHKLSPKQQFFRPKNASEKKGYVPRRYIPLCLRIACFAFVHLVLHLCIRLRVWDKEAAVICAPTSSCPQVRRPCTKNTPSTSTPRAMRYQPNSRKLCFLT